MPRRYNIDFSRENKNTYNSSIISTVEWIPKETDVGDILVEFHDGRWYKYYDMDYSIFEEIYDVREETQEGETVDELVKTVFMHNAEQEKERLREKESQDTS